MPPSPFDDQQDQSADALVRPRYLADRWGKSQRTLQRWRAEGRGPAWLKIGGSIFHRLGDVVAYEETSRREGEPSDDQ